MKLLVMLQLRTTESIVISVSAFMPLNEQTARLWKLEAGVCRFSPLVPFKFPQKLILLVLSLSFPFIHQSLPKWSLQHKYNNAILVIVRHLSMIPIAVALS